jgi:hypothetical protein
MINFTYLKMSFKCFRFIFNVNFVLYTNERPFVFSKTTTMKMAGILRMSLAGVKYGKYAHLAPDVVTYEFYECFSSVSRKYHCPYNNNYYYMVFQNSPF